ncbi:MAG TPA: deoxyribonuclease IV [Phycisphaerae bacterium]|nr:deoxyribonuclease IV [Phycisphaerae bacterium]
MPVGSGRQRFGAHMSVAGGLHTAFDRGRQVGCDCLQIFVKNQRQWRARPITDEQVRLWRRARRDTQLRPVFAHGTYLVNLASPDRAVWRRSVAACWDELVRCERLGIRDLIVHPGAHGGRGVLAGIARVTAALNELFDRTPGAPVRILLETTAGQGNAIGHEFEQLAEIIGGVGNRRRVGVCIDTAHVFAAGYDLRTLNGYAGTIERLDRAVGLRRVRCLHLNDSKTACGSRVDRHDHIGRGKLGRAAFRMLLNDPRLMSVPRILETPKGEDGRGRSYDRNNLDRLRRLVTA